MGKNRRTNPQRKTRGKRSIDIKLRADDRIGIFQGIGITVVIAALFYKSIFGLLAGVVIIPFWLKLYKKEQSEKRRKQIAVEFKEYMMLISNGLQAGYSLEKAVLNAKPELEKLFDGKSMLSPYAHVMNQKITMNLQVEKAFEEFANSIDLDEAVSLAEIISYAKRSGGDYGKHIRNTAVKIDEKLQVRQEIETITTAKRLELKVMSVMPLGILAYIAVTSAEFISPLYGNVVGVIAMTASLILYGLMIAVGKKIIAIDV